MPLYRLLPAPGSNPGSVMEIVLQRCESTGEVLFALGETPRDIPEQLVRQAKPVIDNMGYKLIEVPTPDEIEAKAQDRKDEEQEEKPVIEEEPVHEEPALRPPPQTRQVEPLITDDDEKEEVS